MFGRAQTFVDDGRSLHEVRRALGQAGFDCQPSRPMRRILLDTFDGRLHDAGLRLEHRNGDGDELILSDGRSADAHLPATSAPRFADDLAAGPFRARVAAAAEIRALLPALDLTATATPIVRRNRTDKVVASATIYDRLSSERGHLAVRWAVEVVELRGYDRAATQLVDVLDGLGLRHVDGDACDLLFAELGVDPCGVAMSPTIALQRDAPASEGFRAVLAHLAATIEVNRPGTIADIDPEFLHDLRVAVRRTRSVLSHAKRILPADVRSTARVSFTWMGGITGAARDLDVYQIEWGDYVRALTPAAQSALEPVRTHLQQQRRRAHEQLAADLRSDRAADVLGWWRWWLDEPSGRAGPPAGDDPPDADTPMADVVGDRIVRAQRRMIEAGRAIDATSPAEAVHELRKDAKRLRYLLECFGGLYPAAPRKAFVQRLKTLQDNLGTHQDADVHATQLRGVTNELAGQLPVDSVMAAGQLVEQLEQRRAATRAEFADRFADYDSKVTRRALGDLLATVR